MTDHPIQPPITLPTVEEASEAVSIAAHQGGSYTDYAEAVLDLIASRVPVWVPVEPGTVIKAGTRVREDWDGQITEWTLGQDEDPHAMRSASSRYFIDPRTVPAEPEDPRIAVVAEWWREFSAEASPPFDLLARLDALEPDA